jgi:hypothetical protein
MKNKLSEENWKQLYKLKSVIAKKLKNKFPSSWNISSEEIEDKAWNVILHYIDTYKSGKQSIITYILNYSEMATYRDLYYEYRKKIKTVNIDDVSIPSKKSTYKTI